MDACHTGIVVVQVSEKENCLFGRQNTRLPQFCRPELQPGQVLPQEAFLYHAPLASVPVVAERAQAALETMGAIPASVSADHSLMDAALTRMSLLGSYVHNSVLYAAVPVLAAHQHD